MVKTEGANIKNGISMDQVAAATLGPATRIPSLQLGIDGGSSAGDCDSGYSCAYARNISWASETQPLPKSTNPQVVWDILFGGFDPKASAEEQARQKIYRTSVLDYVLEESKSLSGKLGTTDRRKLDEYMTGVSELEKKIQKTGSGPLCAAIDRPPGDLPLPEHVKMMLDLTALAIQCDATRVVSFMLANAGSGRSYPFLLVNEAHHEISHHQGLQENFDKLTIIDRWEVEQLAYLLGKLDAIDEGNGTTALDTSAVFFSSEIEDGNSHSHTNLPIIVGGRPRRRVDDGQAHRLPERPGDPRGEPLRLDAERRRRRDRHLRRQRHGPARQSVTTNQFAWAAGRTRPPLKAPSRERASRCRGGSSRSSRASCPPRAARP